MSLPPRREIKTSRREETGVQGRKSFGEAVKLLQAGRRGPTGAKFMYEKACVGSGDGFDRGDNELDRANTSGSGLVWTVSDKLQGNRDQMA